MPAQNNPHYFFVASDKLIKLFSGHFSMNTFPSFKCSKLSESNASMSMLCHIVHSNLELYVDGSTHNATTIAANDF